LPIEAAFFLGSFFLKANLASAYLPSIQTPDENRLTLLRKAVFDLSIDPYEDYKSCVGKDVKLAGN